MSQTATKNFPKMVFEDVLPQKFNKNNKKGVSDESKRACPRCNVRGNPNRRIVPRGNDRCMKCGREYTSNGGPDKTYFVPITFCQACGNRENCFEFKDLK